MRRIVPLLLLVLFAAAALAQSPAPAQASPMPAATQAAAGPAQTGGTIHGVIKAGTVPLPGVSVTAANSLTGKRYSTTTDIAGRYTLTIPQNGRYVLRTDLAAFAPATKDALLNATSRDQTVDFGLELASRVEEQQKQQQALGGLLAGAARQYGGSGAQSLNLMGQAADLIQAGGASGDAGAALPSMAGNADLVSGESVAVNGQGGTTNPFAGVDFGRMRDSADLNMSLSGGPGGMPGPGGMTVMVAGPGGGGGGRGGRGGRGGGPEGGMVFRGNFRNFKWNQPHGALFWNGGNSALNAEDFALRGQPITQPAYASNRFGATIFTPLYIPKVLTNDQSDVLFFTLSGTRTSTPFDQYATVPTAAERAGDFTGLTTPTGQPITIYDPHIGQPYGHCTNGANANNPNSQCIPSNEIEPQATALLNYIPLPNLPGTIQNFQRLATTQQNQTQIGFRFIHTFGGNAQGGPIMRMARQFLGQGSSAITQSVNANFNYHASAADEPNIFAQLGGKTEMHQYALAAGYSIGKGRLVNNVTVSWNRSHSQAANFFSNVNNIAPRLGLTGLPSAPQLWGLPDMAVNQFTGMNEMQPSFELQQTVGVGEGSSWVRGKHNIRFGADFHRVYQDMIGNTNSTGSYVFTGLFTAQPGTTSTSNTGVNGFARSGSSLADMLLGLPQETSLQAAYQEAHLRENTWDAYVQDDWRAGRNVTVLAGLRYEYNSPYSERNDRLATLDVGNNFTQVATVTPNGVGPYSGKFPRDLVYPERNNFSPRLGIALHPWKQTTIRGGYGINYTLGQYVKFVQNFAFEPPFADVQSNLISTPTDAAGVLTCSSFCLANGFPAPQTLGNYAVNKNYRLPYVQVWNANIQRTLPWEIVLSVGYTGQHGSRLDIVSAPGRFTTIAADGTPVTTLPNAIYDYEDSIAFSNYNAGTISARKRMSGGISLQATYTYAHAIDDATSIGGNGGSGNSLVQNWQNIRAEESNSPFDIRHRVRGNFVYELPFGPDTHLLTAGWLGHRLANVSASGDYEFATGEPLTPHYNATVEDVSRGTTNSLRPDRVSGVPLMAGGGRLNNWFNRSAFAAPAGVYGTASRLSIPGPGTVSLDASLSKEIHFGERKNLEMRATAENVLNMVQYSGVDTTLGNATYGNVISAAPMRQFSFMARYRF